STGLLQVSSPCRQYLGRKPADGHRPADESSVVVPSSTEDFGPQAFFPVLNPSAQLVDGPRVIVPVDRAYNGQISVGNNQWSMVQIMKTMSAANLGEMILVNLQGVATDVAIRDPDVVISRNQGFAA